MPGITQTSPRPTTCTEAGCAQPLTPRPGNPRWLDCATHGGIHYTEPDASPAPADTQPLSLTELDTFEMEDVEAQSIDWRQSSNHS